MPGQNFLGNRMIRYEQDFNAWLLYTISLIQQDKFAIIDKEHLIEELEGVSKNQQHELLNRLRVLLAHLLKWQFQPRRRCNSWRRIIVEQRQQIRDLLEDSPSLKHRLTEKFAKSYIDAVEYAAAETGLTISKFPATCPYSYSETLDHEFYPDNSPVSK